MTGYFSEKCKVKMTFNKEDLLNTILSKSTDGYVLSNKEGKIIFVNKVIEDITGFNNKDLINEDSTKLFSLPESLIKSNNESNIQSQAAILNRKEGKKITYRARHIEMKDKFYLTIFHTENPIDSSVDRAQVDFVSTVSHELRTPLTSIRGFAETLIRSQDKLTEENKKKYMLIIKEQADRLTRLVEDLLAVSRLEANSQQLTIRSLDLKKYIPRVCESLNIKWKTHTIIQEIEEGIPNVFADADRLEQILTNLIDNAIKYSPNQDKIKVKVTSIINKNIKDNLKIEITDYGIGIGEIDQEKIFTKFGRLDNPLTRQAQGTGLGLFITKSLVLALKGEIFVRSQPGETTFTVILPTSIESQAIPLSSNEIQMEQK